ncbi:MAG: DUF3800 domain-containing protein [Planctomycetes bacterium]|nr:DUF3800 domain-containing protein [Planctomycetota bacterium]
MRILYLDDSGKIHPNDPTSVVVFGGFSIDESNWHRLVRQLNGAKAAFFSNRGNPNDWEIKSSDFLTRNNWNRAKKRQFCHEVASILRRNGCHVYVVSMNKSNATPPLQEPRFVPLAFQRLAAKFHEEVKNHNTKGTIVCDWSTHHLDRHITHCVSSMISTYGMYDLFGGVTYGDSIALPPLQIADLIARTFRITLEGQTYLAQFKALFDAQEFTAPGLDVLGFDIGSIFKLF